MNEINVIERRALAHQVLSITDELVQRALDEAWSDLFDIIDRRRALLHSMHEFAEFSGGDSCLAALTAAVTESEKAVARVVAHAIVGASAACH